MISGKLETGSDECISADTLLSMYATMLKIRMLEEFIGDLVYKNEVKTPCHLYVGQEAVATGVCASLQGEDVVFSTHRSHGHYIAKGGNIDTLMAEIYCKKTGCSKGYGGSMHIGCPERGLPGSSAIVAGTIPLAVGAALAFSIRGKKNVSVAFFGDGATNEGVFYESINFAGLKRLPLVFVCENNLYSTHMPIAECLANPEIYRIAEAFSIPAVRIDGNDVIQVYQTAKKAIEKAREGNGPVFIECLTYRWKGHVGPNDDLDKGLRNREEVEAWMKKCPISEVESVLKDQYRLSEVDINLIKENVSKEIASSYDFAKTSPYPDDTLEDIANKVFIR